MRPWYSSPILPDTDPARRHLRAAGHRQLGRIRQPRQIEVTPVIDRMRAQGVEHFAMPLAALLTPHRDCGGQRIGNGILVIGVDQQRAIGQFLSRPGKA
jgi:hypothetical protein